MSGLFYLLPAILREICAQNTVTGQSKEGPQARAVNTSHHYHITV